MTVVPPSVARVVSYLNICLLLVDGQLLLTTPSLSIGVMAGLEARRPARCMLVARVGA